jgi:hypothetical protein
MRSRISAAAVRSRAKTTRSSRESRLTQWMKLIAAR